MTPNPQSVCKHCQIEVVNDGGGWLHKGRGGDYAICRDTIILFAEPSEPASLNAPAGTEEKREEAKKDVTQDKEENQPRNETTLAATQTPSPVLAISPAPQPVAGEGTPAELLPHGMGCGCDECKLIRRVYNVVHVDLEPLKRECDRKWENESPQHIVNIAANAIHWQKREIAERRGKFEALVAGATPNVEEITGKIIEVCNYWHTNNIRRNEQIAAILRPFITPAGTPENYYCPICRAKMYALPATIHCPICEAASPSVPLLDVDGPTK